MFRILCDPSSGNTELCLTEIDVVCVYGPAVPYTHTHKPQVQNYAAKHRPNTPQNICESLRVISFKHSSVLPDDGSHKIRNMPEWFLIVCILNFYTTFSWALDTLVTPHEMCATTEMWEACWRVSRPELHVRSRDVSRVTEVWICAIEFNVKSSLTSQLHA